MQNFKLCLLAAGCGTRINKFHNLHKSLLPVENKPVISKILDKFPSDIEVVVAIGHKSNQVKSYLNSVYSGRKFTYVQVENFSEKGSGPGLSLLNCKEHLQCPFVFTSIDTLVEDGVKINSVESNWIGTCSVSPEDSKNYCLVLDDREGIVQELKYNVDNSILNAFIGMAGIYDYDKFWDGLSRKNLIKGEHQVMNGLDVLIKYSLLKTLKLDWYDTGNIKAYNKTKSRFPNNLVIEKNDEIIYHDNNKIIKYFENDEKCEKRINRALSMKKVFPKVNKINKHMFAYDYVDAKMLTDVYETKTLEMFLEDYKHNFLDRKIYLIPDSPLRELCGSSYIEEFQNLENGILFLPKGLPDTNNKMKKKFFNPIAGNIEFKNIIKKLMIAYDKKYKKINSIHILFQKYSPKDNHPEFINSYERKKIITFLKIENLKKYFKDINIQKHTVI